MEGETMKRYAVIATWPEDENEGKFGIYFVDAKSPKVACNLVQLKHGRALDIEAYTPEQLHDLADRLATAPIVDTSAASIREDVDDWTLCNNASELAQQGKRQCPTT